MDEIVQLGELDTTRILGFNENYNPYDPTALGTKNTVNPKLANSSTDEVIVGVDREVAEEFAVGASYLWRRIANDTMADVAGLTSADYVQRTYQPPVASCPVADARCEAVTYWEPTISLPSTIILTNRPDYDRRYHGFEMTARKRMRHGWMLDGSFTCNVAREHFRSPASYDDPTNIDKLNESPTGQDFGPLPYHVAGATGAVFVNSAWLVKASGAYTLPWRIGVAGAYQARQGAPFVQGVQTPSRANAAGTIVVMLDRMGDVRLPALQMLDLGVTRPFQLGPARLTASFDVFNVTNVNTVLARQRIQNSKDANQVRTIVAPRVARVGVRVSW